MGFFSAAVPVYLYQAFPRRKGVALSTVVLAYFVEKLVDHFVEPFVQEKSADLSFDASWIQPTIPALVLFVFCLFVPHSPSWLTSKRRFDEAEMAHKRFQGNETRCPSNGLSKPEEIVSFWDLFTRKLVPTALCAILVQLVVQLSETSILTLLVEYLGTVTRLQDNHVFSGMAILKIVSITFTALPLFWLDKCKRKDVLVFGTFLAGCSFSALWTTLFFYGHVPNSEIYMISGKLASAALAVVYFVTALLSAIIGCTGWLYTLEVFPDAHKAHAMSICMAFSWIFNGFLLMVMAYYVHSLRHLVIAVFAAIHFIACVVILQLRETKPDFKDERIVISKAGNYPNMKLGYPKSPFPSVEKIKEDFSLMPLTIFGDSGEKAAKNEISPNSTIRVGNCKNAPLEASGGDARIKDVPFAKNSTQKQATSPPGYEDIPLSYTVFQEANLTSPTAPSRNKPGFQKGASEEQREETEAESTPFTAPEEFEVDEILQGYTEEDSPKSGSSKESFYSNDWITTKNRKYVRHRVPTLLRNSKSTFSGEEGLGSQNPTPREDSREPILRFDSLRLGAALGGADF